MPPAIFARYDAIRIINLPHRTDRRREMDEELEKCGLRGDPRVAYFPAVLATDAGPFMNRGTHGCFLSHLGVLEQAARDGRSVLVLEDDCTFLPAIFDYQPEPDCDVFCGGYLSADEGNLAHGNLIGAHFMGFSAEVVPVAARFLRGILESTTPPDPQAAAEPGFNPAVKPPVDGAYVWLRRANPQLTTAFAQLGGQRSSRTDIGELKVFDRLPLVRDLAQLARQALRSIKS